MLEKFSSHLYNSIPDKTMIDIGSVMLLTMCLIIVDVGLRLLIEATRYNKEMQKPGTLVSILFTMIWRGWGIVRRNGKNKRYMMSKDFRSGLAKKMLLQYPGFFLFSLLVYIYPDYELYEIRVDEAMSVFLFSLPVLCEMMSIIENLNELDPQSINSLSKLFSLIHKLKG